MTQNQGARHHDTAVRQGSIGAQALRALSALMLLTATTCSTDRGANVREDSGGARQELTTDSRESERTEVSQPPPSCTGGASVDPPADQLALPEGAGDPNSIAARLNHLRRLMKQYPQSSNLRVKAAALSLGAPPAGNPVESQQLLQEALKLHDNGCRLPEELEWEANENLGLALLLQQSYDEAAKIFERNAARWPTIPHTHYDLACAKCRLNKLDECFASFAESLRVAEDETPPAFIDNELTAYHFVNQSRQSSDLAILRADPRYEKTIAPHIRQP